MASSSRSKRSRAADVETEEDAGPAAPDESVIDSLAAGRDPRRKGATLFRAQPADFEGISFAADGESRAYLLTEPQHLSLFFPSGLTRDRNKPLLPDWNFVKLLPPSWYSIVFTLAGQPGRFRAVSAAKLTVDGYPAAGKQGDAERAAGFTGGDALRLLVLPHALRFFWAGLHEPLRVEGAWPTAPQVLMRGFVLAPEARAALGAKLDVVAPEGAEDAWCVSFRSTVRERHWGAGPTDPLQQLELIAPLLGSTATDVTAAKCLVAACVPVMEVAAAAMEAAASDTSVREATGLPEWCPAEAASKVLLASAAIAAAPVVSKAKRKNARCGSPLRLCVAAIYIVGPCEI